MGRSRALAKCNITVAGQYKDYPFSKVSIWISHLGGESSLDVNKETTHVVASGKAWRRQDAAVKTALKLIEEGKADIKVVSFDWLEDSISNKTKKREGPYLWTKLDAPMAKRDAARQRQEQSTEPKKGHMSMMAEVFHESTKKYVDPRQALEIEKQLEEERRVNQALEEEEKQRKEQAELYARGAKRARNDIFTENHHIYSDDTGFKYDIPLTKVDTSHNRNERYILTLQIYESNAEPHTYAMNCQFAGTGHKPANNVIVALGSPYPPAFRAFKKCFKEKTGADWDDRILHAVERAKKEKRERGQATGSEDLGSRNGVAVNNQREKDKEAKGEQDFEKMFFEYHPPRFGPRGKLPMDKIPAQFVGESNKEIEHWMSGANGAGPDKAIDLTEEDAEGTKSPPKQRDPSVAHFEELLQDHNGDGYEHPLGPAADPTDGTASIFDRDLGEWVQNNLDDFYPFDHTAENLELLEQARAEIPPNHTYLTAVEDQDQLAIGDGTAPVHDQVSEEINTTALLPPISFDLPSTVQDSFEPGTQDVSETQMAERAQAEYEEFIDHSAAAGGFTDPMDQTQVESIDLGSSVFGKRKKSPTESSFELEAQKKQKRDGDEEEAFAIAAEESFDSEKAYQVAAEAIENVGDDGFPRSMQEDYFDPAAGVDDGTDAGAENGMVVEGNWDACF